MDKVISYLHIWLGGLTAENWAVLGTIAGSTLATIGVTAWIKRKYLQKNAKKLASEFIVLNVAFWSFLLTVADFVITNGQTFAGLLPFLGAHWPQISSAAIATHAVATGFSKWWKDRKEAKPLTLPVIDTVVAPPVVDKVHDPIPSTPPNLWQ